MTYFGMLKEFGLRPDEVDKLPVTMIKEFKILTEILKREEMIHARG